MSTAKFSTWLNPNGTENYKCRAWVNFDGTGTVAIRASGNVSSITDGGVGVYTVNFTTAMPDANYAVACCATDEGGNGGIARLPFQQLPQTGSVALYVSTPSTGQDSRFVSVAVFR